MHRRKIVTGSIALALTALGLSARPADARRAYCKNHLYACPGKQNAICHPKGNGASCFRKGEYKGEATRL